MGNHLCIYPLGSNKNLKIQFCGYAKTQKVNFLASNVNAIENGYNFTFGKFQNNSISHPHQYRQKPQRDP